jgi:hypothetical protein
MTPFAANLADGLNDMSSAHHRGGSILNELEPVGRHQVMHRLSPRVRSIPSENQDLLASYRIHGRTNSRDSLAKIASVRSAPYIKHFNPPFLIGPRRAHRS